MFAGSHGLSCSQSSETAEEGRGGGFAIPTAPRPPLCDLKRPSPAGGLTAPHPSPLGSTPNSAPSEHGVDASNYRSSDSSSAPKKRPIVGFILCESALKSAIHDEVTAMQECEASFHGIVGFSGVSSAHSKRKSVQNVNFWGEMSSLLANRRDYLHIISTYLRWHYKLQPQEDETYFSKYVSFSGTRAQATCVSLLHGMICTAETLNSSCPWHRYQSLMGYLANSNFFQTFPVEDLWLVLCVVNKFCWVPSK